MCDLCFYNKEKLLTALSKGAIDRGYRQGLSMDQTPATPHLELPVSYTGTTTLERLGLKVETIRVHHLGPGSYEVAYKLLAVVVLSIDFGITAQDRV